MSATAIAHGADHRSPIAQATVEISLDDVPVWRVVCSCGQYHTHFTPMPIEALALVKDLQLTTRPNTLTSLTLEVVDFKEVTR